MTSTDFAYYTMVVWVNNITDFSTTLQLDLFTTAYTSGPWDELSQGVLANNTGTEQNLMTAGAVYPDPVNPVEYVDMYPVTWLGSQMKGSYPKAVYGWVVSDGSGGVMAWGYWNISQTPVIFNASTDTLTMTVSLQAGADYI